MRRGLMRAEPKVLDAWPPTLEIPADGWRIHDPPRYRTALFRRRKEPVYAREMPELGLELRTWRKLGFVHATVSDGRRVWFLTRSIAEQVWTKATGAPLKETA